MAYSSEGTLEELFDPEFATRAAVRMARAVGGDWVGDVARRTPVASVPEAYGDDVESWIEDRGRTPGTARRSWSASEPEVRPSDVIRVVVDSDDYPIIIWIEHDTKPHAIVPKNARSLRFPFGASFRYASRADHPGTTGKHMQRDAMAHLESAWRRPAQVALERAMRQED